MRYTTFRCRYYDVRVFVCKTRRAMEKASQCLWPNLRHDNFAARTGYQPGKQPKHPFAALMLFSEEDFGAGVVAHEITHLMVDVWRHRRNGHMLLRRKREEEAFATAVGELNREFWNWWYDDDGSRFCISAPSATEYMIRRTRKPRS